MKYIYHYCAQRTIQGDGVSETFYTDGIMSGPRPVRDIDDYHWFKDNIPHQETSVGLVILSLTLLEKVDDDE